jgi:hypothetical protein
MSDSIKVEEKPKLEDITMEDATSSTPAAASTVSAVEEFAPQKNADGELIIKDLPEALKGKSEEEVAEVKKAIVEQGELVGSISNFYMRVLLASRCAWYPVLLWSLPPCISPLYSRILLFRRQLPLRQVPIHPLPPRHARMGRPPRPPLFQTYEGPFHPGVRGPIHHRLFEGTGSQDAGRERRGFEGGQSLCDQRGWEEDQEEGKGAGQGCHGLG